MHILFWILTQTIRSASKGLEILNGPYVLFEKNKLKNGFGAASQVQGSQNGSLGSKILQLCVSWYDHFNFKI